MKKEVIKNINIMQNEAKNQIGLLDEISDYLEMDEDELFNRRMEVRKKIEQIYSYKRDEEGMEVSKSEFDVINPLRNYMNHITITRLIEIVKDVFNDPGMELFHSLNIESVFSLKLRDGKGAHSLFAIALPEDMVRSYLNVTSNSHDKTISTTERVNNLQIEGLTRDIKEGKRLLGLIDFPEKIKEDGNLTFVEREGILREIKEDKELYIETTKDRIAKNKEAIRHFKDKRDELKVHYDNRHRYSERLNQEIIPKLKEFGFIIEE